MKEIEIGFFVLVAALAVSCSASRHPLQGLRGDIGGGTRYRQEFTYDTLNVSVPGISIGYQWATGKRRANIGLTATSMIDVGLLRTRENEYYDNPTGWSLGASLAAGPYIGSSRHKVWVQPYAKLAYQYSFWDTDFLWQDPCGCLPSETIALQQPKNANPPGRWLFGAGLRITAFRNFHIGAEALTSPIGGGFPVAIDFSRPLETRLYIGYVLGN